MRKPAFCICENKDADQLRGNAKLISAFVFATQIVQSLYFLSTNFKSLTILCGRAAWFVCDLVGNPEDRFSHNEAQIVSQCLYYCSLHILRDHTMFFSCINICRGSRKLFEPEADWPRAQTVSERLG